MNYQGKFNNIFNNGFTVVELIVVVAIFILFAAASQVAFFNFQSKSNLEISSVSLVEALRHAKSNAQQVQGDTKWGVAIVDNQIIVFAGNSYATRNTLNDQINPLTSGITVSGLSEIVFEKVTGQTQTPGTITLSNQNENKNITINSKGTISY